MPPLRPRVAGTNDDPRMVAKDGRGKIAKDAPKTVAEDDRGKIVITEEREIPENKPEVIPMNGRNATKKQEAKGTITREATESQHRRRNTEVVKKIGITRKDLATETGINEEREGTKPILEKIDAPTTKTRRRFPKRRVSVVFSPNFSANRLPLGMQKQRVHAHSGSL